MRLSKLVKSCTGGCSECHTEKPQIQIGLQCFLYRMKFLLLEQRVLLTFWARLLNLDPWKSLLLVEISEWRASSTSLACEIVRSDNFANVCFCHTWDALCFSLWLFNLSNEVSMSITSLETLSIRFCWVKQDQKIMRWSEVVCCMTA